MTSKLKYHKNYTEFGEPYQLVLPLSLEGLIPNDDSVRLLSHELEDLNYSLLYKAYSAKGRNPAVDPKIMFKILAYAYSQNIYSSRKIESACRRDINFMWLLAGQKAPDHSTIARFRTGFLAEACESLFYQMVKRLEQAGGTIKGDRIHRRDKVRSLCQQVYLCVEKVCREMGRKDVPEDTGCRTASELRIHADFFGQCRNKDAGFTENIPFFGREMPDRGYRFCKRTRQEEK